MKNILVYGTDWCIDCLRTVRYLRKNNISFYWFNIDHDPSGEEVVLRLNNGFRSVPTILFADGSFLTEPGIQELSWKLKDLLLI